MFFVKLKNIFCSIVARKSNIELKLEHNTPIFVDEYYPIRLTVENKEEKVIENLKLSVELQPISNSSSEVAESQVGSLDAKLCKHNFFF